MPVAWGLWCYLLFRMRLVKGDFVGRGGDGAQTNRIGTGMALQMAVSRQPLEKEVRQWHLQG